MPTNWDAMGELPRSVVLPSVRRRLVAGTLTSFGYPVPLYHLLLGRAAAFPNVAVAADEPPDPGRRMDTWCWDYLCMQQLASHRCIRPRKGSAGVHSH